ncbi:MAG: hypothetical protein AB2792_15185 [Candidatus Thiodiazotropha sp.]
MVAGLGTITPASGFVGPAGALVIGLLAGVFSSASLGVFSGYGFTDGIESMGGQFSVQVIGVVTTIVFTGVATFVILKLVDALLGLRGDKEQEIEALGMVASHE